MKKETEWPILETIFIQHSVCIRPNGPNHDKAKTDFEAGKTKYYTFPIEKKVSNHKRGYIRTIPNVDYNGEFVDFISPWADINTPKALSSLASYLFHQGKELYIPNSNLPPKLKGREKLMGEIAGTAIGSELNYRVYCAGSVTIIKL